ncbi:MAG: 3-dehydroquinate synthase, partial [Firmicutes bacterium]|nr:3-dehydroquinate synthase [Bacillota bacterium]
EEMIYRNIALKARFVASDERDRGERRKLNLGHTFGHAVELCSGYQIPHGEAVSIGMAKISRAAEKLGVAEPGTAEQIAAALRNNGLPTETEIPAPELLHAILQDKKRGGKTIDLILPVKIGECIIRHTEIDELPIFLEV